MRHYLVVSVVLPTVLAVYLPFCASDIHVTTPAADAPPVSLWQEPVDIGTRNLFYGAWGEEHAPIPNGRYALVERKHTGVNPGLTVRDAEGREWSVKQAFDAGCDEGPIEVVMSRVLWAVGYHQPPVYYQRTFTLEDDWGRHEESGGRFRLKLKALKDRGEWSWQQNPFVGTEPYQGLLVILMLFNSSDLKNSNNVVYEYRSPTGPVRWFVTRDVGASLGTTGRFAPEKGNVAAFERDRFILGVRDGYVEFDYHGWHQELVRRRITTGDLRWATDRLGQLSDAQWRDAFRAGGIADDTTRRFMDALRRRIGEARAYAGDGGDAGES